VTDSEVYNPVMGIHSKILYYKLY
jgi:hypothetical protein